ncbi:DNA restriction methylase [Acetobacter malorum DSM 14337]|uniref:DNA restriction methylase n=1 Tax=Acetobacter malorum DSM 14337 TaxID=1307910 RepID=A0ABQ0PZR9_9PROT|nr:class I SAM-dependent methyltransferase [Acetobacter malorum]GBQ85608.1 DNA restriction methylase [Acetobacter malorum DSM 14337]
MSGSTGVALPPNLYALLEERNNYLARMEAMASEMTESENSFLFSIFSEGGIKKNQGRYAVNAADFFDVPDAAKRLDARMWKRAVDLSQVMEYMPLAERRKWSSDIHECKTPEFTEEHVIPTLKDYIARRYEMIAQMVDGIFSGLSDEHLTNVPQGFGRRMILSGIQDHSLVGNAGHIHDLRRVIAMLSERPAPSEQSSFTTLSRIPRDGKWHDMDGRAIQIRRYLKGTAHLQIHPDMAWQLNKILATLHPSAIPAKFRTQSKSNTSAKTKKAPTLILRPIPFEVLQILANLRDVRTTPFIANYGERIIQPVTTNRNSVELESYYTKDSGVTAEACSILERIGGTRNQKSRTVYEFNYPPKDVINEIVISGVLPDEKSHQFCPTGKDIAEKAASLLDVHPGMTVLEPSAGTGNLVDALGGYLDDLSAVQCVEVSELHGKVLESKGLKAEVADFMSWASKARNAQRTFDRVIMNPPFCNRQWRDHLVEAATLVAPGGRLVAILPSSVENGWERIKELSGWKVSFYRQEMADFGYANVYTTIITLDHPVAAPMQTPMAA